MSADKVIFGRRLQKQLHLHTWVPKLRLLAVILTVGEVIACYILFRRTDFLGAYATAAYLAKEHVIARFVRGE